MIGSDDSPSKLYCVTILRKIYFLWWGLGFSTEFCGEPNKLAVAERPRNVLCLSVAPIVQYVEHKFRFRFTAAYNSILFCSLPFVVVVHAGRDKQDHWCVAVCAVNCTVDGRSCCSHSTSYQSTASCSSRIAIFAYPTCIQCPPLGAQKKLEWFGYPMVKKVWGYDYSFWQHSWMWQSDRWIPHDSIGRCGIHRIHSIARQKFNGVC